MGKMWNAYCRDAARHVPTDDGVWKNIKKIVREKIFEKNVAFYCKKP